MINWFDMPAEGLSNGGLFEVKELEATENGTYETSGEMYNKVTVNVEGGGGSSDFSTAEVTIINNSADNITIWGAVCLEEEANYSCEVESNATETFEMILYKNIAAIMTVNDDTEPIEGVATGDISGDSGAYTVTGDCTITIS